jgi:hypothetical protein
MPKEVVISNSNLNSYGLRVLTQGIDINQYKKNPIMLWMHNRPFRGTKDEILPIGRIENLRIDGDNLIGTPIFDETDDYAKKIKDKWENNILRMASAGLDIIEVSDDPQYLVQGQTRMTVTKSKLVEVSIVDIGSNDDALALYDKEHKRIKLSLGDDCGIKKINDKKRKRKMTEEKEKELVKAIGLSDSASDQEIIDKVNDINLKAQKVDNLEQERENERNAAIDSEVENAIKCGKITEDKKEHFISLGKKLGLKELQETISCIKNSIRPSDVIHNEDVEKSTEKKLSDLSNEDKIKLRKENKNEYIKLYKNEYGVNPIIED